MLVQLFRAERGEEVLDDVDGARTYAGSPQAHSSCHTPTRHSSSCPGEVNPGRERHASIYGR